MTTFDWSICEFFNIYCWEFHHRPSNHSATEKFQANPDFMWPFVLVSSAIIQGLWYLLYYIVIFCIHFIHFVHYFYRHGSWLCGRCECEVPRCTSGQTVTCPGELSIMEVKWNTYFICNILSFYKALLRTVNIELFKLYYCKNRAVYCLVHFWGHVLCRYMSF